MGGLSALTCASFDIFRLSYPLGRAYSDMWMRAAYWQPPTNKPDNQMVRGNPIHAVWNEPAEATTRLNTRTNMRSSKSRSRSKSNRSRTVGNIVNRVFDSSGPEGKVRGTPQQIIDKYTQLARDAQLANDRVAAENFQQHAEHYTRLLGEAQREQEARREQQEQQKLERQQQQQHQRDQAPQPDPADEPQPEVVQPQSGAGDVIDLEQPQGDSTLVETPEEKPAPKRRSPRKPRSKPATADETAPEAAKDAKSAETAPETDPDSQTPAAE